MERLAQILFYTFLHPLQKHTVHNTLDLLVYLYLTSYDYIF